MSALGILLDLVVDLIQHPVATLVTIGVCCLIMYILEQKSRP